MLNPLVVFSWQLQVFACLTDSSDEDGQPTEASRSSQGGQRKQRLLVCAGSVSMA